MKNLSSKDKIIHDEFSRCGKNAKEWMNKCVLLLPKIEKNEIWRKKGFSNIYDYARKIAGMSRNKVNEGLRILKKTENLPAIRALVETRGIFAIKPVISVATSETDEMWAKRASEMKKSTLEVFVKDYKNEQDKKTRSGERNLQSAEVICQQLSELSFQQYNDQGFSRPGAGNPENNDLFEANVSQESLMTANVNSGNNYEIIERISVSMKLDPEVITTLKKIKGEGDWNATIKKLLKYSQKELEAEQELIEAKEEQLQKELSQEKPAPVKSNNHTVTTAIKNYIKKRSKGLCEHPNCHKPGKHIHHIQPFALKKEHNPDKLIYLCEEHHQIIHLGYIDDYNIRPEIKKSSPEQFSPKPIVSSWQQIKKLPSYDIKNLINKRISEFRVLQKTSGP